MTRNSHSLNQCQTKTLYSSVDQERDLHQLLNKLVRMGMGMLGIIKEVGWIGKRGKRRVMMVITSSK